MSSNAPWSVKGIDPKAREIAKDLARRSGKTLGEWLNEVIIEGEGGDGDPAKIAKGAAARAEPEADEADRGPYREVLRDISRQAARETAGSREAYRDISAYEDLERARPIHDDASRGGFPEGRRRPTASVYPDPARRARFDDDYAGEDELSRVTRALDRLSARIEAAENRSTVAISGIDQSVVGVLNRLDQVERENTSVAARFEGAIESSVTAAATSTTACARWRRTIRAPPGRSHALAGGRARQDRRPTLRGRAAHAGGHRRNSPGRPRELTQGEYRTRAAVGELREEISDSEQRARAAFGVLREELTEREHRTLTGLESLHQVVAQTEQTAREQVGAVREDLSVLAARVERTEMRQQASPLLPPRPNADPAIVVDQVVAKVAHRLEQAESKTSDALRSLQASFAGLDQRLKAAETSLDPDVERRAEARFETLASELGRAVDEARTEMAQQLTVSAENFGRIVEQTRTEVAEKLASTADGPPLRRSGDGRP
jgi:localization factor PodJL